MGNVIVLFIILSLIILIGMLVYVYLYTIKYFTNKDNYLVQKHLLDETCEVYKRSIYEHKLEQLKVSHNLDENSPLNAIKAFNRAHEKLTRDSASEIYKKLSKSNLKCLRVYYSEETILLIIINYLRT